MVTDLRILIINPNTTQSMTDGLKPLVESLSYNETAYTFFTAPSGPSSINNEDDAAESAKHCLPRLEPLVSDHDAALVACYSEHPLVPLLRDRMHGKPVLGIFEASVTIALQLLNPVRTRRECFGIVSTGKVWEGLLTAGVAHMLGDELAEGGSLLRLKDSKPKKNLRFAGVETTGLNAEELHDAPQEEVRRKIQDAAGRLMAKADVKVICLGCAGMAGMDQWIKEEVGKSVRIVDGVKSGVGALQGLVRGDSEEIEETE